MSSLDTGGSPLDKPPPGPVSDFERRVSEAMNSPYVQMALLKPFMEYATQYLALNQPPLSINSIFGFTQFTAHFDSEQDASVETTASASYTDLATVGPSLTGLPDGVYLLLYSAAAKNSIVDQAARVSVEVNATAASDADAAETQLTSYSSIMGFSQKTLDNDGNNTVTLKYRTSSGTGSFFRRRLIALKVSNL